MQYPPKILRTAAFLIRTFLKQSTPPSFSESLVKKGKYHQLFSEIK